jgi:hypothetical protein
MNLMHDNLDSRKEQTVKLLPMDERTLKALAVRTACLVFGLAMRNSAVAFAPDEVTFGSPTRYTAGNYVMVVAVGDLNEDGAQDVVTANTFSSDVSVLLGNGDGTLQVQQRFSAGIWPYHLALADLNADGALDVVVPNRDPYAGPGDLSILLGNGNGTLQPEVRIPAGSQPMGVVVADINNDSKPDLAVTLHGENQIAIRLGNGDGTFQPAQYAAAGAGPQRVIAAEMNGDGNLDLVVANWWSYDISVVMGNGDGTFGVHNRFPIGERCNSHTVGDLNRDGFLDVVAANSAPWDRTVSILLGNGDGTLQPQRRIPVADDPYGVASADLNRDGVLDLVVTQVSLGRTLILLGNGDGSFQLMPPADTSGCIARWVAVADLDGDTLPDLVLPHGPDVGGGEVWVLLQVPPNHPPRASCRNVAMAASEHCAAHVSIDDGSFDPDPGDTITLTQSPPGPYPLGNTPVTLTVTDSSGASDSCLATVTVVDTTPPSFATPNDLTVNADSPIGAVVTFETPVAADNCSVASVLCEPASGTTMPIGTTTVTCTAMDMAGNSSSATFTVQVKAAVEQLPDLIGLTEGLPINRGLKQSLVAKLSAAKQALDRGYERAACLELRGFLVEVRVLAAAGKLTAAQAGPLIADGGRIRAVIGCP